MSTSAVTQTVRRQYEELPYPPRNPEDDRTKPPTSEVNHLAYVNHHCYAGRRNPREGFRVLVAGGGTGDATIFLAWQLRRTNATIFHVDLSQASIDVARKRARVCNLNNIKWIRGSLLDLPTMNLPKFDFINCSGVLHHLEAPPAGLATLRSVMKNDGAMGLMLYGRIGRTAVYLTQELMRRLNAGSDDISANLDRAEAILRILPKTNWLKRSEDIFNDHIRYGKAGIYDGFLHSQDRAYTAEQVHELLHEGGMKLAAYIPKRRFYYRPENLIADETLLAVIQRLPTPQQETIMELIWGGIIKHEFWAVPGNRDTRARLEDLDNVPFYPYARITKDLGLNLAATLQQAGDQPVTFTADKIKVQLQPNRLSNLVFKRIDGRRCLDEIFDLVRQDCPENPTNEEILAEFTPNYDTLSGLLDQLLLAHKSVAQFFQQD